MHALTLTELRRRAEWIVVTRLVLVGGVIGALCIEATTGSMGNRMLLRAAIPGLFSTSFLILEALRRALRRPAPPHAVLWTTMLAAILNPALFLLFSDIGAMSGRGLAALGPRGMLAECLIMLAYTVVGLVFSFPLGLAYAGVHYFALKTLTRALASPSHRTLTNVRLTSVAHPVLGLVVVLVLAVATEAPHALLGAAAALLGAIATLDLTLAAVGSWRRRRWLRALHADRVVGHRLVPWSECTVAADLVPLEPLGDDPLAVVVSPAHTPYRSMPDALMLVPKR